METVAVRSEPSVTITEVDGSQASSSTQPVLRLRLKKPKSDRKVEWHEGTIDNEHMGRKKSKCCCIYKKPTVFGESSSEDEEECEHCFGHPEKRKRNKKPNSNPDDDQHSDDHNDKSPGPCDDEKGECPLRN